MKFFGVDRLSLLHKPFPPSHERALRLLGLDGLERIALSADAQYAIGDTVYCEYSAGIADYSASRFMADLHDRLGRACQDGSEYGRLIYVSRMNTTHRRMIGEAELVHALSEIGFTILDPAPLSLDQQISAFRKAKLVMGPHGAGMANVVFCSPGAEVYQLFPRHFDEPSIMVMSLRRGLAYWADTFISDIEEETPGFLRDWQSDVPFVLARAKGFAPVPVRRRLGAVVRRLVGLSRRGRRLAGPGPLNQC